MRNRITRAAAFAASLVVVGALGAGEPAPEGGAPAPAPPAGIIKPLLTGIPHAALFGLSMDAGTGVAVGAGGAVFESKDGGTTWKPSDQTQSELALLAVDRRGQHTIAVGQMGLVLVEDPAGKWVKVDSGSTGRLLSVSVNSNGLAVAGGEFGTVLKSTDGGQTWSSAAPDWAGYADPNSFGTGEPTIYAVHVSDSGAITIAGEFGVMLRSVDNGATWRVLHSLTAGTATIFAIDLAEPGQGKSYAVGQTGLLLESSDGGESWASCDMGIAANFLGVAAAPNGHVLVTGMRVMVKSDNGGMTWDHVEEGDTLTDWYQAARADASSNHLIAVGHAGKIIQVGS